MIYPTRLTILLAAAIAPLALLVGLLAPALWTGGLAVLGLLLAACAADALLGAGITEAEVACEGPRAIGVSETFAVTARATFKRSQPATVHVAFGISGPVSAPLGLLAIWSQFALAIFYYPTLLAYVGSTLAYVIDASLAGNGLYTAAVIITLFWGSVLVSSRGIGLIAKLASHGTVIGTLIPGAISS